ncbi:hypothetical protein Tsubulata_019595, partial [Turnera subulata]
GFSALQGFRCFWRISKPKEPSPNQNSSSGFRRLLQSPMDMIAGSSSGAGSSSSGSRNTSRGHIIDEQHKAMEKQKPARAVLEFLDRSEDIRAFAWSFCSGLPGIPDVIMDPEGEVMIMRGIISLALLIALRDNFYMKLLYYCILPEGAIDRRPGWKYEKINKKLEEEIEIETQRNAALKAELEELKKLEQEAEALEKQHQEAEALKQQQQEAESLGKQEQEEQQEQLDS